MTENNAPTPSELPPVPARRGTTAAGKDIIRHDRDLILAPQLFAVDPDGRERKTKLPVQGGKIQLISAPLSAHTLRVLCGVITLMQTPFRGDLPERYMDTDESEAANASWKALVPDGRVPARMQKGSVCLIKVSRRQLAEAMSGKSSKDIGGAQLDAIVASLLSLSRVTIYFKAEDRTQEWALNLLGGWYRSGEDLTIAINPRLVEAVMDRTNGRFSLLSMDSLRALRSEVGAILYHRLCGTIDPGKTLAFSETKLMSYVWMQPAKNTDETCDRRKRLVKALKEISHLSPPWAVDISKAARGRERSYRITRPKIAIPEGTQIAMDLP